MVSSQSAPRAPHRFHHSVASRAAVLFTSGFSSCNVPSPPRTGAHGAPPPLLLAPLPRIPRLPAAAAHRLNITLTQLRAAYTSSALASKKTTPSPTPAKRPTDPLSQACPVEHAHVGMQCGGAMWCG